MSSKKQGVSSWSKYHPCTSREMRKSQPLKLQRELCGNDYFLLIRLKPLCGVLAAVGHSIQNSTQKSEETVKHSNALFLSPYFNIKYFESIDGLCYPSAFLGWMANVLAMRNETETEKPDNKDAGRERTWSRITSAK